MTASLKNFKGDRAAQQAEIIRILKAACAGLEQSTAGIRLDVLQENLEEALVSLMDAADWCAPEEVGDNRRRGLLVERLASIVRAMRGCIEEGAKL